MTSDAGLLWGSFHFYYYELTIQINGQYDLVEVIQECDLYYSELPSFLYCKLISPSRQ